MPAEAAGLAKARNAEGGVCIPRCNAIMAATSANSSCLWHGGCCRQASRTGAPQLCKASRVGVAVCTAGATAGAEPNFRGSCFCFGAPPFKAPGTKHCQHSTAAPYVKTRYKDIYNVIYICINRNI